MSMHSVREFKKPIWEDVLDAVNRGKRKLSATEFVTEIRNLHIRNLPSFTVKRRAFKCAYCGKSKGRRSMQIDHLIPASQYCRWKLFFEFGFPNDWNYEIHFRSIDNLILACQKCNGKKQDHMPDRWSSTLFKRIDDVFKRKDDVDDDTLALFTPYQLAVYHLKKFPEMQSLLKRNQEVCKELRNSKQWQWVVNGRQEGAHYKMELRNRAPLCHDVDVEEKKSTIDEIIRRKGKPSLDSDTRTKLEERQFVPRSNTVAKKLRLCFYCLGLFQNQAFQLDHIRPVNRGHQNRNLEHKKRKKSTLENRVDSTPKKIEDFTKEQRNYNDPRNILAVCRTCNSRKSNGIISRAWLEKQIESRKTEGLVGVENVVGDSDIPEIKSKRDKIIGSAFNRSH